MAQITGIQFSDRDISSLQDLVTVSGIVKKWKHLETTATEKKNGRPHKVTEQHHQSPKRFTAG